MVISELYIYINKTDSLPWVFESVIFPGYEKCKLMSSPMHIHVAFIIGLHNCDMFSPILHP